MSDAIILSVLQTTVTASVAASPNPALPVKYVMIDFTPPNDQKWLEIVWFPNNRNGDFWGSEKNYRGSMRLILHWPNNGEGPYLPMQLLTAIAASFTKDTLLQGVQIYDNPDSGGVLEMGSEILFPVTIRYQYFAQ